MRHQHEPYRSRRKPCGMSGAHSPRIHMSNSPRHSRPKDGVASLACAIGQAPSAPEKVRRGAPPSFPFSLKMREGAPKGTVTKAPSGAPILVASLVSALFRARTSELTSPYPGGHLPAFRSVRVQPLKAAPV